MRSFVGRRISGELTGFDAQRVDGAIRVTVTQVHGPSQRYWLYWNEASPIASRATWLDYAARAAMWVVPLGALGVLLGLAPASEGDPDKFVLPVGAGLTGLAVLLLLTVLIARINFWRGMTDCYQYCPHSEFLPETLAAVGSPAGGPWAIQAVNALREGSFCMGARQLHGLLTREAAHQKAAADPERQIADLVLDAAAALRMHDRLADAGDVLLFVDVVPTLTTLDSETARQAAQTILDSYRLLDEIPVPRRSVCPAGSTTTPEQDATAAVDAALRGIDAIVATDNDSDIAALQALRRYSERWNTAAGSADDG